MTNLDAIVIGAGFGGIRMLHELGQLGVSAKVLACMTRVDSQRSYALH
jgi:cation diffusion facilitator CzcD-associated flavoprotein CzcO